MKGWEEWELDEVLKVTASLGSCSAEEDARQAQADQAQADQPQGG